jgi:3-hydroxyacyl-CoA dehydrogenase/enoyl-CoA hydratase/3-hydroxybutyryl-CoA epimerase/3-hydroxyacyl-CoA dehydrogenase/enoyl-CoA hydratase/3-hydroxybutyryl-CoA epimerase/enoyl-CoA isomerase
MTAQTNAISVTWPEPDIALLTFDLPGKSANILSRHVLDELEAHLNQLAGRQLAGLIVNSAKAEIFLAGADLREFVASFGAPAEVIVAICRRGQNLFARFAELPCVTVAAVHGTCLGGGAELISWCDRRLVTNHPRTEIGFPEVQLGLYPGWGGTVRLPRLIGLPSAVEMITSGESISAAEAVRVGLALGPVSPQTLISAAVSLVREEQRTGRYLEDRRRTRAPVSFPPQELEFLAATASALISSRTGGHYPAPMAALELMLQTASLPAEEALVQEAQGMASLFGTPVNRALVNVFFLTDHNKRSRGVERADVQPATIQRVGILGAGIMGSGIAGANLRRGLSVVLTDAVPEALQRGARTALEEAAYDRAAHGPQLQTVLDLAPKLATVGCYEAFRDCDLVIEAVVENMQVKQQVFQQLESLLPQHALIASNTSTIPITRLAQSLRHPERFCGIHFFNPVRRMKLVEVIRGAATDDSVVATAVAYAKRLGKMPVVVRDGPGFLVNRLLFPYMNEALELLLDGAEIEAIERAAKAFGMPMGPIELYDMVGLDTALYAGRTMWEAFPNRVVMSPLLPALVKAGRLGQKSGRGFFLYATGGKKSARPQPDPELPQLIQQYRRQVRSFTGEEIQRRLILPMVLEATRVLEEQLVSDVRDVDIGLIFGIGFPAFRGGLLFWADQVGAEQLLRWLEPFASLGERMQPTELLLDMARRKAKFYG